MLESIEGPYELHLWLVLSAVKFQDTGEPDLRITSFLICKCAACVGARGATKFEDVGWRNRLQEDKGFKTGRFETIARLDWAIASGARWKKMVTVAKGATRTLESIVGTYELQSWLVLGPVKFQDVGELELRIGSCAVCKCAACAGERDAKKFENFS